MNCKTIALAITLFVALFAIYKYSSRTIAKDNSALGIIYYEYRWGSPDRILMDSNRDGVIDFRISVKGSGGFDGPGSEFWEDRNYDGHFELHAFLEAGEITKVQIDNNGDGTYDRELEGEEAQKYYRVLAGLE